MHLERALERRRKYFTVAAGFCVALLILAGLLAGQFGPSEEVDFLTLAFLGYAVAETAFFPAFAFDPARVEARLSKAQGYVRFQKPEPPKRVTKVTPFRSGVSHVAGADEPPSTLDAAARSLTLMAASFVVQPVLLGTVLVTLSGDFWRAAVFAPMSALAGLVYWRRLGSCLIALAESDTLL